MAADTSLRTCRQCGCWDDQACFYPMTGRGCYWVALDLCSACAGGDERVVAETTAMMSGGEMFDDPQAG